MTTYIGNPPKSVYGVQDATNVMHDFITDGTTLYDLDVDFANDGIYDIAVFTSASLSETLSIYDTSDLTNANYITQYWHIINGAVTSAGADSDAYTAALDTSAHYTGSISWRENSSGSGVGYLMWEGQTLTYSVDIREQHYAGYYNGTLRAAPAQLRLVANGGTALSAGTRIIITKRQATNLVLPLEYSVPQKNYMVNPTFSINQRGYVDGTNVIYPNYLRDRWKAYDGIDTTAVTQAADGTITVNSSAEGGYMWYLLEDFGLDTGKMILSWEGTGEASVHRANGDTTVFHTSPVIFNLKTGVGGTWGEKDSIILRGNGGTYKNIKLERGSMVTPFEYPDMGTELAKCQRYYYKPDIASAQYFDYGSGFVRQTTSCKILIPFNTAMRVTPTLEFTSASNFVVAWGTSATVCTSLTKYSSGNGPNQAVISATVASGLTVGQGCGLTNNNQTTDVLAFNAEL